MRLSAVGMSNLAGHGVRDFHAHAVGSLGVGPCDFSARSLGLSVALNNIV